MPLQSCHRPVQVGDSAPDFTLNNQQGEPVTLSRFFKPDSPEQLPKAVVLFFYPKDNTPGCTQQACQFRDRYAEFQSAQIEVIGVSADDHASHQAFTTEYQLPFQLLSDPGNQVRHLYGVPKTLGLLPGRVTYMIDAQGVVKHIFNAQLNIEGHIREALQTLVQETNR